MEDVVDEKQAIAVPVMEIDEPLGPISVLDRERQ